MSVPAFWRNWEAAAEEQVVTSAIISIQALQYATKVSKINPFFFLCSVYQYIVPKFCKASLAAEQNARRKSGFTGYLRRKIKKKAVDTRKEKLKKAPVFT